MPLKRALVVDDSRSARVALRKLLEEHDLEVAEANSGETALEYLKRDNVDVIFMDHTMPGMDGLEAVSAIKANPQTAMIPVMMYTTREGEVYVGQARALGAVGVLPKNVQPHQLFEMLLSLGLVRDRRTDEREYGPAHTLSEVADEVDNVLNEQALGMSVQALVTRILEDQHLNLRSDILRSQKTFAREVAHEILKEQVLTADTTASSAGEQDAFTGADSAASVNGGVTGRRWFSAVLTIIALVCIFLAWQFKNERDTAYRELVDLETSRSAAGMEELDDLSRLLGQERDRTEDVAEAAVAGFTAALSSGNAGGMYEDAYSASLASRLAELLPYIERLSMAGEIVLTSHLGRFCLTVDETGSYQLAPEETLLAECEYMGHVLENSAYVSDRLSLEFANLLRTRDGEMPLLKLVALPLMESEPAYDYPREAVTAGVWNGVARQNNRVEITIEREQKQ